MMTVFATLAIFSTLLLSATAKGSGWGTAYSGPRDMDKTGENMCEFDQDKLPDHWQVYYAAMNEADWNAAGGKEGICGRCISVRGTSGQVASGHTIKPIIVKIVDQCPDWACDKGSVDFSTTALEAITGYSWDKKKITWVWTDCPSSYTESSKSRSRSRSSRKSGKGKRY